MNFDDLKALQHIISESNETEKISQGSLQPSIQSNTKVVVRSNHQNYLSKLNNSISKEDSKDIWDENEIPTEEELLSKSFDLRPAPKYSFYYKNSYGTEDIFLNIDNKSQASCDCSHLVVKIHFPGASLREIELDILTNVLKASSLSHRLFTQLPQTVDHLKGTAKFDTEKEMLLVTLPILSDSNILFGP